MTGDPTPAVSSLSSMAMDMDMLEVIHLPAPKGPLPPGMKTTCIVSPDSGAPAPTCTALAVGAFTLWALSYTDNRVSFGMVMYDPDWRVVSAVERPGARYLFEIVLEGSGASGGATFVGQARQSVRLSLDDICALMMPH